MTDATVKSAVLLGSDHTELGETFVVDIGPDVAIGISPGRFPKGYRHVDPNEDAVFAATDGSTTVLAVADGHQGFDAAHAAITSIAATATSFEGSSLEPLVRALAEAAINAVRVNLADRSDREYTSQTSLTICASDDATVVSTTLGDTVAFIASKRRAKRISTDGRFLDHTTTPDQIEITTTSLRAHRAVIVASDGLTEFAASINGTLRSAAVSSARGGVEGLLAAAFAGGAGDNIAIAILHGR